MDRIAAGVLLVTSDEVDKVAGWRYTNAAVVAAVLRKKRMGSTGGGINCARQNYL